MSATKEAAESFRAHLENIEAEIERKTQELRDLKKIRRDLTRAIEALEKL